MRQDNIPTFNLELRTAILVIYSTMVKSETLTPAKNKKFLCSPDITAQGNQSGRAKSRIYPSVS